MHHHNHIMMQYSQAAFFSYFFIYFRVISHEFVSAFLRNPCGFFPWFLTGIPIILFLKKTVIIPYNIQEKKKKKHLQLFTTKLIEKKKKYLTAVML